jgi:hypothetical protein
LAEAEHNEQEAYTMATRLFALLAACLLLAPITTQAQTARAKIAPATTKPPSTASGVMKDNCIAVRRSDWIKPSAPLFNVTLTNARIVDGRLEFRGSTQGNRKQKGQSITATLVATSARSANPWPSATAPNSQPRQRAIQNAQGQQPTANQTQPPGNPQAPPAERTERNEQTQSLFSAAEACTGCELPFLKMQAMEAAPLQVGVVLAHQDNERGNEINKQICRVVRALEAKENTDEALAKLKQSLNSAR